MFVPYDPLLPTPYDSAAHDRLVMQRLESFLCRSARGDSYREVPPEMMRDIFLLVDFVPLNDCFVDTTSAPDPDFIGAINTSDSIRKVYRKRP